MNDDGHVVFGAVMQLGQQNIRQANIVVDSMFNPYDEQKAEGTMLNGFESIPNGALVFQRRKRRVAANAPQSKRARMMRFTKPTSQGTRALPSVFCNLKYVSDIEEITYAGVSDTMVEIRGDDWRYRAGRSVIVVIAGIRTVMNSGPDDIYEGEWVYWDLPIRDIQFRDDAPSKQCHRAVLRPVTAENYKADPDCIYRTVGKCVEFSQAGHKLNLSLSSAQAPVPYTKAVAGGSGAGSSVRYQPVGTPSGANAPDLTMGKGDAYLRKVPPKRRQQQEQEQKHHQASATSAAVSKALRAAQKEAHMTLMPPPKAMHLRPTSDLASEDSEDGDEFVDDEQEDAQSSTASSTSSTGDQ